MCLLALQWQAHPSYPFILVANRDEAYDRASSRLHYWTDSPQVLAGRDLTAMGTWLGVSQSGRFSGITNQPFADVTLTAPPVSRGKLVRDYLEGETDPVAFGVHVKNMRKSLKGFRMLFGHLQSDLFLYENPSATFSKLTPGMHSVSSMPNDHAPEKEERGKDLLFTYTKNRTVLDPFELASLFHDTRPADETSSLETHLNPMQARQFSSVFIEGDQYGTVSTAVILMDNEGFVTFMERKYNKKGMHHDTLYTFPCSGK